MMMGHHPRKIESMLTNFWSHDFILVNKTIIMMTENETNENEQLISPHYVTTINQKDSACISQRHLLAFLAFLGFVNVYALRVNLSVALVSMVQQPTDADNTTHTGSDAECPYEIVINGTTPKVPEFDWDSKKQGLVLSAFFYGYLLTQVPGGWLAERIGGTKLFGSGVLCTAVLTLLTPVAARQGVYWLIAVRVLEGFGEGVTYPAMHAILAKWAPPLEKTKLSMFIYAGSQFGTVVSLPISGVLCESDFLGGWPSVFYLFGAVGCVWFIFWIIFTTDSPVKNKRIARDELAYLQQTIGLQNRRQVRTPWSSMFTSPPFIALIIAHTCNNWGFYTLLTCLPTFLSQILHVDIAKNGFLSALPYLAMWIVINIGGQLSDYIRAKQLMSTTAVRKIFNTAGFVLPAIFLVTIGYTGCNTALAISFVTLSVGLGGLGMSGYCVNHLDLAPLHTGTMMGITNTVATIPGIVGPELVGYLTANNHSREQWQKVFFIAGGVYVFGALVFLIFASGKLQKWNDLNRDRFDSEAEHLSVNDTSEDDE